MPFQPLQHLSVRLFSAARHLLDGIREWIWDRPKLSAWFYRQQSADSVYRDHNGRMFADLHEQERMLADRQRMNFYQTAISRHIQPGDRVIDLGTGTGILAALASRRGAGKVYAIDHSDILKHAQTLAAANQIKNVEFVATHSTAFQTDEPVDVILHEQMGDCLFDEDMVANVTNLRDRLLKPNGLILPSRFEFFCEPVKINNARLVPFIWELDVCGYDYSSLEYHRPQDPYYYHLVSSDLNLVEHFLARPEPVLTLDLHTINATDLPPQITFTRTVVNAGRLDGYAVFFRARVDHDLTLSSDPTDIRRAPHWGFRILRCERDDYAVGDEIIVTLTVGQWPNLDTWRWTHQKKSAPKGITVATS
ncbi:MAG: 50S ribosomal protein L11 methyltransferase [Cephaloticoccus sp.]|nr:50S ribosomal protein L11 methyltransferase [Cephaloticoccus sp.]